MPLSSFTPEQQEYLRKHTEATARSAVRHYRNRALTGFLILFLGLIGAFTIQQNDSDSARTAIVVSARNVATDGCNYRFRDRVVLRKIVSDGAKSIQQYVEDGTLTQAQADRALAENKATLAKLKLPDCRVVQKVVTDDPSDLKPNQPPALYPGYRKDAKG